MTRLEPDQYVAVGAEVIAQYEAEQRELADLMPAAELGNLRQSTAICSMAAA